MVKNPKFIFILTSPNSGSTVLAHILNSSKKITILNQKAEGQWLVDELSGKNRWNEKQTIDWKKVKNIWLKEFRSRKKSNSNIEYIVEKSPPNILRINQILKVFKDYKIITYLRDPIATCASMTTRMMLHRNANINRNELILSNIERWIEIHKRITEVNNNHDTLSFTYEEMCNDTYGTFDRIIDFIPEVHDINPFGKFKVKDYSPNFLLNFNEKQKAILSDREKEIIKERLAAYKDSKN